MNIDLFKKIKLYLVILTILFLKLNLALALPECVGSPANEKNLNHINWNDCKGVFNFSDGTQYKGEWKNGKENGKGIINMPNGGSYKGGFKDGIFYGDGVLNFPDGRKWVGFFDGENFQGEKYSSDNKKEKSILEKYLPLAINGDSKAQTLVGYYHLDKKQYKEALKWFHLADKQNHSGAQNYLGLMYSKGLGVKLDNKKAISFYEKSASQGNVKSLGNLGDAYVRGKYGLQINTKLGISYLHKAALKGSALSMYSIGLIYANGVDDIIIDQSFGYMWLYFASVTDNNYKKYLKVYKNRMNKAEQERAEGLINYCETNLVNCKIPSRVKSFLNTNFLSDKKAQINILGKQFNLNLPDKFCLVNPNHSDKIKIINYQIRYENLMIATNERYSTPQTTVPLVYVFLCSNINLDNYISISSYDHKSRGISEEQIKIIKNEDYFFKLLSTELDINGADILKSSIKEARETVNYFFKDSNIDVFNNTQSVLHYDKKCLYTFSNVNVNNSESQSLGAMCIIDNRFIIINYAMKEVSNIQHIENKLDQLVELINSLKA